MPTTVKLLLRTSSVLLDEHGDPVLKGRYVTRIRPTRDEIDLDRLSPRARAMAEAIAVGEGQFGGEIWLESDRPIRDLIPQWRTWYSPERADHPERRPWSAWDRYKADDPTDPHDWLERQAAKIPAGWHVYGASPHHPVMHSGQEMTVEQVLVYLEAATHRTIKPGTWRAYVTRGDAPAPVRRVGNTPLWSGQDIAAYAEKSRSRENAGPGRPEPDAPARGEQDALPSEPTP